MHHKKSVEFCSQTVRCQVFEMWSQGDRVACGLVTPDTKVSGQRLTMDGGVMSLSGQTVSVYAILTLGPENAVFLDLRSGPVQQAMLSSCPGLTSSSTDRKK